MKMSVEPKPVSEAYTIAVEIRDEMMRLTNESLQKKDYETAHFYKEKAERLTHFLEIYEEKLIEYANSIKNKEK